MKNLFSLKDKVIVITGAAGLLGRQHANIIAEYEGIPILLDINHKSINELVDELKNNFNIDCSGYVVDITNESDVQKNCQLILKKYGHIDGLINNAANNPKMEIKGSKNFSRLENFSTVNWDNDISVGLKGAFICSKHYGKAISKQGGSIVNISSDLGIIAPDQRLYRKENLAEELQPVKPVTYSVIKRFNILASPFSISSLKNFSIASILTDGVLSMSCLQIIFIYESENSLLAIFW